MGNGTVKVNGKKTINSKTDVIPIKERGFLLDFIIALQIAWQSAENKISIKIKLTDNVTSR